MDDDILYEEKAFSKVMTATFAFLTVTFFSLGMLGLVTGDQLPVAVLLFSLFLVFAAVTINFNTFQVLITPRFVKFGHVFSNRTVVWETIESCSLDEVSPIRYGGFGIRFAKVKGNWIMTYSVPGYPRVLLSLKQGRIKYVGFSAKNPEIVVTLINQQVGE